MKEIVILSGKGGTGKTTVAASLAVLASDAVIADADVDAADLHIVLKPVTVEQHEFRSGHVAVIRQADCDGCGVCKRHCRFDAIRAVEQDRGRAKSTVDPSECEGCGVCVKVCPKRAIDFPERVSGEWFISRTRFGWLVHARLYPAAENSGKLVTHVRNVARRLAHRHHARLIITDGPPGIGCPAIAAVSGADAVLIVTEPTVSGAHDLERVLGLVRHFNVPAFVTVNKWDINPDNAALLENRAAALGVQLLPRIPFDSAVVNALVNLQPVVEFGPSQAADQIRRIWAALNKWLN